MVKCPYCGTEHSEGTCFDACPHCHAPHQPSWAKFCNSCGAELTPTAPLPVDSVITTKRCPQCHTAGLPESASFCSVCGYDFNSQRQTARVVVEGGPNRAMFFDDYCPKKAIPFQNEIAVFRATMYPWLSSSSTILLRDIIKIEFINIRTTCFFRFEDAVFERVDLSALGTSYWTTLTCMFCWCYNLRSLDLSSFDTKNVQYVTRCFSSCKKLELINLSGWDLSNVKKLHDKFDFIVDCPSLRTIIMRGCNDYTVDLVETALEEAGLNNVEIIR